MLIDIIVGAAAVLICWRFGEWSKWSEYYSTILFFILGDMAYNFSFYNHPLWMYGGNLINHTFTDIFIAITLFPTTIILYNTFYPNKVGKKIIYVLLCSGIYSLIEFILYVFNSFFIKMVGR
ncbi:hypothetical protein BJV85_003884 [Clostridium acetobutylicum]|nr:MULTISPECIES: CBO0543 family protein [Clostridium]NOV90727.1 hypothetical protein [Clostridium acetobutylicum]NOW16402.1 hypothetical protein [Clostridium acetobutylicum]NSA94937.1 hypothetical protein [Clostridium acetobutylicum]NYC96029.1 hypothetical protein [Clostridium acetobutylicum]